MFWLADQVKVSGLKIVVLTVPLGPLVPPKTLPPVTSTCPFGMIDIPEQKISRGRVEGRITFVTTPVLGRSTTAREYCPPAEKSGK